MSLFLAIREREFHNRVVSCLSFGAIAHLMSFFGCRRLYEGRNNRSRQWLCNDNLLWSLMPTLWFLFASFMFVVFGRIWHPMPYLVRRFLTAYVFGYNCGPLYFFESHRHCLIESTDRLAQRNQLLSLFAVYGRMVNGHRCYMKSIILCFNVNSMSISIVVVVVLPNRSPVLGSQKEN